MSFLSRDVKAVTWVCNLIKPVDLIIVHVTLYYRYRNGFQKFLIDLDIDVCSYYDNILGSAVVDLVRKEVEKYSTNFIRGCPYTGNMTIINMPLTGALFDYIFLPAGDYKLVIDGIFDKKKLFGVLVTMFFTVLAGKTLEDDNMG